MLPVLFAGRTQPRPKERARLALVKTTTEKPTPLTSPLRLEPTAMEFILPSHLEELEVVPTDHRYFVEHKLDVTAMTEAQLLAVLDGKLAHLHL